jgi:hypothetical protein
VRIPFQLIALPFERFTSLVTQSDEELRRIGVRRMVVDKTPGYPCHVSLVDAELDKNVLLVPFTHLDVASPYRMSGPNFVRVNAQTVKLEVDEIPTMLRSRLLSIRAYYAADMMVGAEGFLIFMAGGRTGWTGRIRFVYQQRTMDEGTKLRRTDKL